MISHLVYIGSAFGGAAMISFYIISGYSITASGVKPGFFIRRFWRLWPSYIAIALIVQWTLTLGWEPGLPGIGVARGWNLVSQVLMIVPTGNAYPALVHSAWMLKWILLGYLVMWMGATKTPRRSAFLLLTGSVTSVLLLSKYEFYVYYVSPVAALTSTAAGACCWHLGLISPKDNRWSALAGELSYPIFLSHYAVGAMMIGFTKMSPSWNLFWISIPVVSLISFTLVFLIERPIQKFQRKKNLQKM